MSKTAIGDRLRAELEVPRGLPPNYPFCRSDYRPPPKQSSRGAWKRSRILKMHCRPGQIGLVSRVGVRCIGEFLVRRCKQLAAMAGAIWH